MGKLNAFQLSFTDNAQGVYQSGQLITGQLFVDLAEPMTMRSITLQFLGQANVHWTEQRSSGSGKNRKTRTVHFNNDEVYFNQLVYVWGAAGGGGGLFADNPEHPAGQHIYPFQFQLPMNMPSSFEGAWGRVRFSIKATIDKPWKFDHTTKLAFTVNSTYDLNQDATARNPSQGQASKTLCCWCCESGPISAVCRLDRMGYVPGEFIVVNGEIDNKSNRTLSTTKVAIRMNTLFHARSKSRAHSKDITILQRGEVGPGDSEIWSGERLHIPPLPPSQLINCNIIDIKYYVVLVADPSGPAFDLECPVGFTVGTVPLQNMYGMFAMNASFPQGPAPPIQSYPPSYNELQPSAPAAPDISKIYSDMPASDPAMPPPPSYAESVFGKVNVREEGDSEYTQGADYAPKYTYYTFNQS